MSDIKRCSSIEHENINAVCYCLECKVYMCNKCENFHSKLCQKHHSYIMNKNVNEIFTGYCKEENHLDILEYFCKSHNQLCCTACIAKIKRKGKGQHSDCNICIIEDIEEEKKKKLKQNIEFLENDIKTIEKSIEELKIIFDKVNENKTELKLNIQKIFTKLRNYLNEREDELLSEVDNHFNNLYFKEDTIKNCEKLPNKIKISLEKGKNIDNEWNKKDKLISLINDCINIENNMKEIKIINEIINKSNNTINTKIKLITEEDNKFLESLKKYCRISIFNHHIYKFIECDNNINDSRKYKVEGECKNIITKIGQDEKFICARCENILEKGKEYKWKIKILKTKSGTINIGVAQIDSLIDLDEPYKYGWFLFCKTLTFYSGKPHDFFKKETHLKILKDEITVIMNMNNGSLKFIIGEQQDLINNIPLDKNLIPVVTLSNTNDSVEIIS